MRSVIELPLIKVLTLMYVCMYVCNIDIPLTIASVVD